MDAIKAIALVGGALFVLYFLTDVVLLEGIPFLERWRRRELLTAGQKLLALAAAGTILLMIGTLIAVVVSALRLRYERA